MSDAQTGEGWLRKYLANLGKEWRGKLWDKNWTAITELCNDSFEEHVLGGLHLHGLNVRSRHFITEDPEFVDAFAVRWGFIKTQPVRFAKVEILAALDRLESGQND